jgi:hypothetical protein
MSTSPGLTPLTGYHFIIKKSVTKKKKGLVFHNTSARRLKTVKENNKGALKT